MPGRLWCRFRSGSMGSGEGLEKIGEAFGAEPGQVQQVSSEGSREGSRRLWCPVGFGADSSQVQWVPEKV